MNEEPTARDDDVNLGWPQPEYLIDQQGHDAQFGVTIDDHCYVVLVLTVDGTWELASHLPPYVAKRVGEIADLRVAK